MNFLIIMLSAALVACQSSPKQQPQLAQIIQAEIVQKNVDGFNFNWGGFSGLNFIKKEDNGDLLFWTLTDRGPNGEKFKRHKQVHRTFLSPNFTPSFVQIKYIKAENKVLVVKTIPFKDQKNKAMTGLPPRESISKVEVATDTEGQNIESDNNGVDSESMAVDDNKHFWVGDEYFPSLLEFDPRGKLLARILPAAKESQPLKKNEIPFAYNYRKFNRGFEALGYKNNKIFFMTQGPLGLPDTYKDKSFSVTRIGVFNTITRQYEAEYIYLMTTAGVDKIGDLYMIDENHFYVIEQSDGTGLDSHHVIYKVDLSKSTNLVKSPLPKAPETYSLTELVSLATPVEKTLIVDLVKNGYSEYEKIEGLTMIDDKTLAIINDNDFGVDSNKIVFRKISLGIIGL